MGSYRRRLKNYWASGSPFVWLTGGTLVVSLMMVGGLLYLIASKALGSFWTSDLVALTLTDGRQLLGMVTDREKIPAFGEGEDVSEGYRVQLKIANRDLYGLDFTWVKEADIVSRSRPPEAVVLQRQEWGDFFGFVREVRMGDVVLARGERESYRLFLSLLPEARKLRERIRHIEKDRIGDINHRMKRLKLRMRKARSGGAEGGREALAPLEGRMQELQRRYGELEGRLDELYRTLKKHTVVLESIDGRTKELPLGDVVRAYKPNIMGVGGKLGLYAARLWEFLSADPRESNTEGGVFPAIFGTVMLVLLMTVAVIPLGVLAALYLREYARQGAVVRVVRICVNNLAGVPSIVFGVFGLGFFIYGVGGTIDRLFFADSLPTPTFGTGGILWASLTLALLTLPVVIVSTEEGLAAVGQELRHGSLALGATKFETIWKVVLPSAAPGILTGMVLAIARATGEVAPLMITGVVKLAPALPVDNTFPFVHLQRKFMHLGFHIYDVGFQSPNVEAAMPMVYSTTFLLLFIVVVLNLAAIAIRNRLRKKYTASAF
jgi:phosphate transport system permease protein